MDRVTNVYKMIGVATAWDDRGAAISRVLDGELHLNVLLLSRDMTEKKMSAEGLKHHLLGHAHLPSGRAYSFFDRIAMALMVPK